MNWEQLSRLADAMSLAAGVMTIVGIGGVLSWLQFGERGTTLHERVWAIAGFGIRTFLALLVLLPLGLGGFWLFGLIVTLFAGSWQGQLWDAERSLAFAFSYFVTALVALPVTAAVFLGIITMRLQPMRLLFRHTLRRDQQPTD